MPGSTFTVDSHEDKLVLLLTDNIILGSLSLPYDQTQDLASGLTNTTPPRSLIIYNNYLEAQVYQNFLYILDAFCRGIRYKLYSNNLIVLIGAYLPRV
jgi:hypothetical protein